jgi:hypothetical protein
VAAAAAAGVNSFISRWRQRGERTNVILKLLPQIEGIQFLSISQKSQNDSEREKDSKYTNKTEQFIKIYSRF